MNKNGVIEEAIHAVNVEEEYINEEDATYYKECIARMNANMQEAVAKNEGIKQAIGMLLHPKYAIANENIGFELQPDGRVKIIRTMTV